MIDVANLIVQAYLLGSYFLAIWLLAKGGWHFPELIVLGLLATAGMGLLLYALCRLFPRWGKYLILPEALVWEPKFLQPRNKE